MGGRAGNETQVVINPDYPPSNQARCRRVTTILENAAECSVQSSGMFSNWHGASSTGRRSHTSRHFVDEKSDLNLEVCDFALALLSFRSISAFAPLMPPPLVIKASRGKEEDEEGING